MAVPPVSPNSPKLLGREVMLWIAVAHALIGALVGMKWISATPEQVSYWLAAIDAVFAVLGAIAVRPFPVPLLAGALSAIGTVMAAHGLSITDDQVTMWNMVIFSVFAFFTSQRVSPEPKIDPLTSGQTRVL